MTPREATRFLLWYGEKTIAGDPPTEEEHNLFIEARKVSIKVAKTYMRLKESDFAYTRGEPFKGAQ